MSAERFELSTNGLKGHCSAIELRARSQSGLHSIMPANERQRNIFEGGDIHASSVKPPAKNLFNQRQLNPNGDRYE